MRTTLSLAVLAGALAVACQDAGGDPHLDPLTEDLSSPDPADPAFHPTLPKRTK